MLDFFSVLLIIQRLPALFLVGKQCKARLETTLVNSLQELIVRPIAAAQTLNVTEEVVFLQTVHIPVSATVTTYFLFVDKKSFKTFNSRRSDDVSRPFSVAPCCVFYYKDNFRRIFSDLTEDEIGID